MKGKLLGLLNREFNHLNQAALILGFFTLFSQILGLVRDKLLAHFLGPSLNLDIYYAAFRVPDFIFNLIASLVSITVLIPFFASIGREEGNEKTREFFNQVFTVFMVIMVVTCLLVFALMPYLAPKIAPGFDGWAIEKMTLVSRIMLLSPILLGLSQLFQTMTQLFKKFLVYALSPILYNFGIIAGIIFFYPIFGVYGLAFGVILGALMHVGIQFLIVAKYHFIPMITTSIDWKKIKNVAYLALPRTITHSMTNLIFLVFVSLASNIREGSISIFTFSYNLQSVPLALIGGSFSVAAFPALVSAYANKDFDQYGKKIVEACRQIIFWSLPAIFLFIVLRAQIVRVILGSGRFTWSDTRLTAASMGIFVISILAQAMILILIRGYYAAGNTKKPLLINLIGAVGTIILAYLFVYLFRNVSDFQFFMTSLLRINSAGGGEVLMLPLSFSIGSIINALVLWFAFKKDHLQNIKAKIGDTFFKSLSASFIIGGATYILLVVFGNIFDLNTFMGVLLQGLLAGLGGIIVGAVFLWYLRSEEFKAILVSFIRRWNKSRGEALETTHLG